MPISIDPGEAEQFAELVASSEFESGERRYKVALHEVLSRLLEPDNVRSPGFPGQLSAFFAGELALESLGFSATEVASIEEAVGPFGSIRNAFANLCGGRWGVNNFVWIPGAIAGGVGPEIADAFAGLVDDSAPLHDRVDRFRTDLRAVEERFEGEPG